MRFQPVTGGNLVVLGVSVDGHDPSTSLRTSSAWPSQNGYDKLLVYGDVEQIDRESDRGRGAFA